MRRASTRILNSGGERRTNKEARVPPVAAGDTRLSPTSKGGFDAERA